MYQINHHTTNEKEVILTTKVEDLDFEGLKKAADLFAKPTFKLPEEQIERLDMSLIPDEVMMRDDNWKETVRKTMSFCDKFISNDTLQHESVFNPIVKVVEQAARKWRLAYTTERSYVGNTIKDRAPHITDDMAEPIVTQLWAYIVLGKHEGTVHHHWPNHVNFCLYLEAEPEDVLWFRELDYNFKPERGSLIMWRGNLDHTFFVGGSNERYTLAGSVNYQKNPENFITKLGKKVINRITG